MCGIVGMFSHQEVSTEIYEALVHLQHRGQDAAGILTYKNSDTNRFYLRNGQGLARNVFSEAKYLIEDLPGTLGLGHVRYPTNGSAFDLINAQPFHTNYPYGIAMVHNGNLSNYNHLKEWLLKERKFLCNSGSDLECILSLFSTRLGERADTNSIFDNICDSVEYVYQKAQGGYSVISIIAGKGMVAFRDPHGIRPLVIGKRMNENGKDEYIFASESNMFYSLGFELFGDVGNGEVVFVNTDGSLHRRKLRNESFTPDAFEYIYFARPDAIINDVSVYRSRLRMGQNLAIKWKATYPNITPDVVIPVPFSANVAALSLAGELGVRYTEGLYKNPFIGRTFIMDSQDKRRKSVKQKLSPQKYEIYGKKVMVVDDSIVRGTTSKEVIQILKDAGAKEIYMVSACPPLFYPDFYGISIPTQEELIASKMTHEELRQYLGVDALLFQDLAGLTEAIVRKGKQHIDKLSMPYFDCEYITGDVDISQFRKITGFEK
jgi:amidophosphoribosyltransferase